MFEYLAMRLFHVIDNARVSGIRSVVREIVYAGRIAVPVEMDLKSLKSSWAWPKGEELTCIEIERNALDHHDYDYPYRNRKLKAQRNLGKGLLGYGLLRGREVVADLWYTPPVISDGSPEHPDVQWLGILPRPNHSYAFDMFLAPAMRGKNIATCFQGSFLLHLRDHGVDWAYGYYWADNIAALWMHRMLKWKELGRVRASRFFGLKTYRRIA